ncbi:MAG: cytochrome c maturation protein CcmE [Armatimonadota bacterium]
MKPAAWFGFLIIAGALAFGAKAFVSNLTPYVTFDQARSAKSEVQVMGKLDKTSIRSTPKELAFTIVADNGDRMPVRFTSAAPANFAMAIQVTAIGKVNGDTMEAKNLLVKCPTKYQGTETKEYGTGKA